GKREQRQTTWLATGGGLRAMIRFGKTAGKARVPTREGRCVSDDQRPACSPCHRQPGGLVAQAFPPVNPGTGRNACATGRGYHHAVVAGSPDPATLRTVGLHQFGETIGRERGTVRRPTTRVIGYSSFFRHSSFGIRHYLSNREASDGCYNFHVFPYTFRYDSISEA